MKNQVLPEFISLKELTLNESVLQGSVPLAKMSRLQDSLAKIDEILMVSLRFGTDTEGWRTIKGEVRGQVTLTCQRCMQQMKVAIGSDMALAIVANEQQGEELPEHYDPLLAVEDTISLYQIIEDEVLIALPLVAKHSEEECPIKLQNSSETGHNTRSDRKNPFEVLATLKDKSK